MWFWALLTYLDVKLICHKRFWNRNCKFEGFLSLKFFFFKVFWPAKLIFILHSWILWTVRNRDFVKVLIRIPGSVAVHTNLLGHFIYFKTWEFSICQKYTPSVHAFKLDKSTLRFEKGFGWLYATLGPGMLNLEFFL